MIRVEEISEHAQTISNEILSRMGKRLPKFYKQKGYLKNDKSNKHPYSHKKHISPVFFLILAFVIILAGIGYLQKKSYSIIDKRI